MANVMKTGENLGLLTNSIVKAEEIVSCLQIKDEPLEEIEDASENSMWNCLENTTGCSEDYILPDVCNSSLREELPPFAEAVVGSPAGGHEQQDVVAALEGEGETTEEPVALMQIKEEPLEEVQPPVREQNQMAEAEDEGLQNSWTAVEGELSQEQSSAACKRAAQQTEQELCADEGVVHMALRSTGANKGFHCVCGKIYRHSSSLWKHIHAQRSPQVKASKTSSKESGAAAAADVSESSTTDRPSQIVRGPLEGAVRQLDQTSGGGPFSALNCVMFQESNSTGENKSVDTNVKVVMVNGQLKVAIPRLRQTSKEYVLSYNTAVVQKSKSARKNVKKNTNVKHTMKSIPQMMQASSGHVPQMNFLVFGDSGSGGESGRTRAVAAASVSGSPEQVFSDVAGGCSAAQTEPVQARTESVRRLQEQGGTEVGGHGEENSCLLNDSECPTAKHSSEFRCFCGRTFKKLPSLVAHVHTHRRGEFQLCMEPPGKKSVSKENTHCCSDETVSLKCSTCGSCFENDLHLKTHIQTKWSQIRTNMQKQSKLDTEAPNSLLGTLSNQSDEHAKERCMSFNKRDGTFEEYANRMTHVQCHQETACKGQKAKISKEAEVKLGSGDELSRSVTECVMGEPESNDERSNQSGMCSMQYKPFSHLMSHMPLRAKIDRSEKAKRARKFESSRSANLSASESAISVDLAKRMKMAQDEDGPFNQPNNSGNNMPPSRKERIIPSSDHDHDHLSLQCVFHERCVTSKSDSCLGQNNSSHPDNRATGEQVPDELEAALEENKEAERVHAKSPAPEVANQSFSCKCGKEFRTSCGLALHSNYHLLRNEYFCDVCGKVFRQKNALAAHLRFHNYQKAYKCWKCDRSFVSYMEFMVHKRLYRVKVRCYVCQRRIIRAVCNPNRKPPNRSQKFFCGKCDKDLNPSDNLTFARERSHTFADEPVRESNAEESQKSCALCKRIFKDSRSLLLHSHSHLGHCTVLVERFKFKEQSVSDKKDVTVQAASSQCPNESTDGVQISHKTLRAVPRERKSLWRCRCGKVFKFHSYLRRHLCKYKGHECGVCRKVFKQKGTLTDHMRMHTGRKKHECSTCSQSFSRLRELEAHGRRHAKDVAERNIEELTTESETETLEACKTSDKNIAQEENQKICSVGSVESQVQKAVICVIEEPNDSVCLYSGAGENCALGSEMEDVEMSEIQSHTHSGAVDAVGDSVNAADDLLEQVNPRVTSVELSAHQPMELQPELWLGSRFSKTDSPEETPDVTNSAITVFSSHAASVEQVKKEQCVTLESNEEFESIPSKEETQCGNSGSLRNPRAPVEHGRAQGKKEQCMSLRSNEVFELFPRGEENQCGILLIRSPNEITNDLICNGQSNNGCCTALHQDKNCKEESQCNPETVNSGFKSSGNCSEKELASRKPSKRQNLHLEVDVGSPSGSREAVEKAVDCDINLPKNHCSKQSAIEFVEEQVNKEKYLTSLINRDSVSDIETEDACDVIIRCVAPGAQLPGQLQERRREMDVENSSEMIERKFDCSKKVAIVDLASEESDMEGEDRCVLLGSNVHSRKKHHFRTTADFIVEQSSKTQHTPPELYEISDSDVEEEESYIRHCKSQNHSTDQHGTHFPLNKPEELKTGHYSEEHHCESSAGAEISQFACDLCFKPFPDSDALQVHKHVWGKVPCNINQWQSAAQKKLPVGSAEREQPNSKSLCQLREGPAGKPCGEHVCEYCGKSFTQKDFLIDHLHWHIRRRKYRCRFCNKTFQQSVKLAMHKLRCGRSRAGAKRTKSVHDKDREASEETLFPKTFAVPFVGVQPEAVPVLVSVPVLMSSAVTWGSIVTLR